MRILILNANLRERGTYFRARKIALGLHARGHDVTFVCTGEGYYRPRLRAERPRWREWESASWSPLRSEEGHSPLGLLQRVMHLRGKWDFIYTFSHMPVDQATARFLRRAGTFWMTDWCDLWSSRHGGFHDTRLWPKPLPPFVRGLKGAHLRAAFRMEDLYEARAAQDADAVSIIVSPMREHTRRLGIPDNKVLHLVSGADTRRITPMDTRECRSRLGLKQDAVIMGYVANYTPDNVQLQAALRIVWKARPNLQMISVGPRWFEPGTVAGRAAAQGRLIDFDRRPFAEIPQYMGAADFLVMPMRDLPFNQCRWPNKFGDYMASGRAVATTDVGDMGRVVQRYQVGIAGAATPEGLAASILQLAEDAELRQSCGENARDAALQHFSWSKKLDRLCKFLNNLGVTV